MFVVDFNGNVLVFILPLAVAFNAKRSSAGLNGQKCRAEARRQAEARPALFRALMAE